jgi:phenylalanyl-tRNA synthetase beta chain
VAPPFSGVVVGEILKVERHPNADKLTVCTVAAGKQALQVPRYTHHLSSL